ncbi:MFS transporter [Nocardiopsis sp. FIRDI 009]|uniref:MFS transporter n=1 Tax=Nocardiopsis sp. FIRDI 009 TaxID=714197 RepID=UPI000E27B11F|nr:MFS transporter [Nocardiopsis sp. FIRDI 009]
MTDRTSPAAAHPARAAVAAFVGTTIEWFDFYVYATAAGLVFGTLFFPGDIDPTVGLMASFATFAVGFFARPLGGVVFGHFGDRLGRRSALVTTLLMMGAATFCVGLLPTYAQVGFVAPLLLVVLRFVQGVAVGGEWGGAVLMAVESAPEERKTFYGSFAQLGNPAGALLATGSFGLITAWDSELLYTWGWRLPFLASCLLVLVGLVVRLKVEESPVFEAVRESRPVEPEGPPLRETLRGSWRAVLLGIGVLPVAVGGYYVVTTFLQAYGVTEVGLSERLILNGLTLAAFVELVATLATAWLGDRFGTARIVTVGLAAVAVLALPQFLVLGTGSAVLIVVMLCLMRVAMAAVYGPIARVLAQMYPPRVRYTGISVSYQVAGALFGGLSPLACTALFAVTGSILSVVALLVVMALVSIACLSRAPRYSDAEAVAV